MIVSVLMLDVPLATVEGANVAVVFAGMPTAISWTSPAASLEIVTDVWALAPRLIASMLGAIEIEMLRAAQIQNSPDWIQLTLRLAQNWSALHDGAAGSQIVYPKPQVVLHAGPSISPPAWTRRQHAGVGSW